MRLCLGRPAVGFTVLGCVWPAGGPRTARGNPKNIRRRDDCGGCCGMFACRRLVFCLVCILTTTVLMRCVCLRDCWSFSCLYDLGWSTGSLKSGAFMTWAGSYSQYTVWCQPVAQPVPLGSTWRDRMRCILATGLSSTESDSVLGAEAVDRASGGNA